MGVDTDDFFELVGVGPPRNRQEPAAPPTGVEPVALTASRLVADHDVAARVARGWNLLQRAVHLPADAVAVVDEIDQWHHFNLYVVERRFRPRAFADHYRREIATGELVDGPRPPPDAATVQRARTTVERGITWLERLRESIPELDEASAPAHHDEPPVPVVLVGDDGPLSGKVRTACRSLLGSAPGTLELSAASGDDGLAAGTVAVMALEGGSNSTAGLRLPDPGEAYGLGFLVGALGADRVIAVCGADVVTPAESGAARVVIDDEGRWRLELGRLLAAVGVGVDLNNAV